VTAAFASPPSGVSFRAMTPDDLDVVLVNEVAAYPFPWTRGNFEDCLKERRDCRLLLAPGPARGQQRTPSPMAAPAVSGPAAWGPAVFGHGVLSVAAGEAHVLNVCIAPVCQGRGYGRVLLDHLLGRAQEQGAEVVFLEVRPSNGVAIALYESVGFNEIGRRRNYYQAAIGHEDALVMALDLRLLDPAFGAASI